MQIRKQLASFTLFTTIWLTTYAVGPMLYKAASSTAVRDKFLWPFSSVSPWNMPIGSGAIYIPANIQQAGFAKADEGYIYQVKSNDPVRSVYGVGAWGPWTVHRHLPRRNDADSAWSGHSGRHTDQHPEQLVRVPHARRTNVSAGQCTDTL